MSNLIDLFKSNVASNKLFTAKDHLLIAVSGGVDSVVLCELCYKNGYRFSVAHCNFQLRGKESEEDEQFVKELAEKYKVPFHLKKFDTEAYASQNRLSVQVAARELRYSWFASLLGRSTDQPAFLLTAHHADDNIETIAMNFFKGSGINGLKGILPKQGKIVRPLLFATKENIISFAREHMLAYREDSSNALDKYTRNYFRNQLLPAIEKVFPEVRQNLLHNAERFAEINTIYQSAIERIKSKLVVIQGKEHHVPVLKLLLTEAMPTVLHEIIKDFGFTAHQGTEVIKLLNSESGKYIDSATYRILRNRNWLVIAPLGQPDNSVYLIEETDKEISFASHKLEIKKVDNPAISKDPLNIQLDSKHIRFPLLLRRWKTGDYFYPLGMKKKKKVSRFLIDQKLSLHQKQDVWVLESDKKIIWVLGLRIDDRFKITDYSTGSLSLRLFPGDQTS